MSKEDNMIDVTEDEIRRSGAEVIAQSSTPEATAARMEAIVVLWKKQAILPMRRDEDGKIRWRANPDFDRSLLNKP